MGLWLSKLRTPWFARCARQQIERGGWPISTSEGLPWASLGIGCTPDVAVHGRRCLSERHKSVTRTSQDGTQFEQELLHAKGCAEVGRSQREKVSHGHRLELAAHQMWSSIDANVYQSATSA